MSNFPEEISSLSHSVVFLYFFALIMEEGFLISPCYSLELCIQMGIYFLFSFAFFASLLFTALCKASSDNHFAFLHFFSMEMVSIPVSCTTSHASKVMLKILQARLQQYVYHELLDVQAGFRKGRGTRDQIATICWITYKARQFQKNIYFCFIDYAKTFDCVDHNKLWKILQEMGLPDHLTCLLRNLYVGQEVTVRTGHGTTD